MEPSAAEIVQVLKAGSYPGPSGEVSLGGAVATAVSGARVVSAQALAELAATPSSGAAPKVEVVGATTAATVARLGDGVGVLVFSQATEVGGGFLRGEHGQEEDLCRASGLYPCLQAVPEFHAAHTAAEPLVHATVAAVFPSVPLFRTEAGYLPRPLSCTMVAMSAPDARTLTLSGRADIDLIPVLTERVVGQLALFRSLGLRTLVLGAWGCGGYGNDPRDVGSIYRLALQGDAFGGAFDRVVFAIADGRNGKPALAAFHRLFPG